MLTLALPATLNYRDFRVLLLSTVLNSIGFRGQMVAVGWLLLEETDSPFLVGLGIGSFLAPNAFVGILGGAVLDRFDRRFILRLASFGLTGNTLLLAAVALGDVIIWQILLLTATGGATSSLISTARQSYAYDIVGPLEASRGLAFVSLGQRVGGVVGAFATGAALSLWGPGEAYLALALPVLLSALVLVWARSRGDSAPIDTKPVAENLKEYAVELAHNRTLAWLVLLTAMIEVFGFSHLSALPVLIRDELGGGGGQLGTVNGVASAGGIVAILAFSARRDTSHRGFLFLFVIVLYGATIMLLGQSQSIATVIVTAALVSALASLSDVLSQVLVQLSVPNAMRGRAMGTWALAIGTAPIGHLQMGALMSWLGVSAALAINGCALMLVALAAGFFVRRVRQL